MTLASSNATDTPSDIIRFLAGAIEDHRNAWSIGTFGAIGEFAWDSDEPCERGGAPNTLRIVSSRGGLQLAPSESLQVVAYDTLSGDGETWGNAVAFSLPIPPPSRELRVRRHGPDTNALRAGERDQILFDLGVGMGHVSMCIRTREPQLIAALDAIEGRPLLGPEGATAGELIRKLSPTRVMLSPAGRIEVCSPIPLPDGKSPNGPHTHLLPKLIANGRTHSANAPIPLGLQPVLMLHPRSPWREADGKRTPYDAALDQSFDDILSTYGLAEDREVRTAVEKAVDSGMAPEKFPVPDTRRGRIQLRITLRRITQRRGIHAVADWQARFDPASQDNDDQADVPLA
jgi:hypothetical protein